MAAPTPSTSDVISAVPEIFCFNLPVCVFGGVVVAVAAVTAVVAVVVMAVAVAAVVVVVVALLLLRCWPGLLLNGLACVDGAGRVVIGGPEESAVERAVGLDKGGADGAELGTIVGLDGGGADRVKVDAIVGFEEGGADGAELGTIVGLEEGGADGGTVKVGGVVGCCISASSTRLTTGMKRYCT